MEFFIVKLSQSLITLKETILKYTSLYDYFIYLLYFRIRDNETKNEKYNFLFFVEIQ